MRDPQEQARIRNARRARKMKYNPNWQCRIKSVPYVERSVTNARGQQVELDVEEMLRLFKKRVSKSGVLAVYRSKTYYQKPSVGRKLRKEMQEHRNRRRTERERQLRRLRGDSR